MTDLNLEVVLELWVLFFWNIAFFTPHLSLSIEVDLDVAQMVISTRQALLNYDSLGMLSFLRCLLSLLYSLPAV